MLIGIFMLAFGAIIGLDQNNSVFHPLFWVGAAVIALGILMAVASSVRMAKMRGISGLRVKVFYVMRNGFIPVFVVLMMRMGFILGGSLVIERIFSYPGLGLLLADAVTARDYPLMQYTFLMTSVMVVITMFLADLLHHRLDPALQSEGGDEK